MVITDIDNTIAETGALLCRAFDIPEEIYPAPTPPGFWEDTGLLIFSRAKPFSGVREILEIYSDGLGGLTYLTCRPPIAEFITKRWLRLHGFPDAPVVFCRNAQEKAEKAEALGAALALEDDPEAVLLYDRAGIVVLMPDRPYNRHVDLPGVARVREVMEWRRRLTPYR